MESNHWPERSYNDLNGHGTHVAGLILKDTCPEVKFLSCAYYEAYSANSENTQRYLNCLLTATYQNPDVINISGGGDDYNGFEEQYIKTLIKNNTIIIAAAGNESHNIDKKPYYPASYKDVIAVGNLDFNGNKHFSSNYGNKVVWERGTNINSTYLNGNYAIMTGTSQSAAALTNKVLKRMCHEL